MMKLDSLISPKSIALIGASNKEGSLGFDTIKMLKKSGYRGEVYLINPKYDEILGYKVYPNLDAIGKPVDTVILCVAAKRVEEQIDLAIAADAKSLVIFANCVLEEEEGKKDEEKLEARIVKKCKDAKIPVMGHNAMGFYNNTLGLRVCGFDAPDEDKKGNIAFISQSGSAFSTIGHNEPQLSFNLMITTGTGQVTSLSDYMLYALEQEETKVLGVYMESVLKPEKFRQALRIAAQKRIPVVLMKVGKSKLGAEFAKSHTGGLAGDDDVIQAVFEHYGVIRVDSLNEMANTLLLFSCYPEIPKGKVAAIADSGGERNLLADVAEFVGLEFAQLSEATIKKLQDVQEYGQKAENPLDPWGTGIDFEKIFQESLEIMMSDENVAIGIVSQDLRDGYYLSEGCISALAHGKDKTGKPAAFLTNFGGTRRTKLTEKVNSFEAPVLTETTPALKSVKNYLCYRDFRYEERENKKIPLEESSFGKLSSSQTLLEKESLELLEKLGFPINKSVEVNSLEELRKIQDQLNCPFVLKTAKEGILHKSDVGGVRLNIKNMEELEQAYLDMQTNLPGPCLISEMASFDIEMIFGMKKDPIFGALAVIGTGGVLTEVLNDKIILLPEAGREMVLEKLKQLKISKLFEGYRNLCPVDMEGLTDVIIRFLDIVKLLEDHVSEMDINPFVLKGKDMKALDALIVR